MKKSLLFLFISCLGAGQTLFAQPIDENKAVDIAKEFYMSKLQSGNMFKAPMNLDFKVVYNSNQSESSHKKSRAVSDPSYYIVTPGENLGYVIVSGDDKALPVLGYNMEGNIQTNDMPENMKDWLSFYDDEISYMREMDNLYGPTLNQVSPTEQYTKAYAPLLKDIKWNQDYPYNLQCPISEGKNTYVGCLATAIGQIMRYHKWPEKGKGKISYTTYTTPLNVTADLDNATYEWDKMLPNYSNTESTEEERNEVAELLFHVGAASNMDYTTYSSGANNLDLCKALINNFSYSKNLRVISRNSTSIENWHAALQGELAASRPVFYTGIGDGGHAFVCDGYDGQGMYHFNWGWGGVSDGYFSISALTPISQGIGGNTLGFNYMQDILINIMPPTDNEPEEPYANLAVMYNDFDAADKTQGLEIVDGAFSGTYTLIGGVINIGPATYNGELAIILSNGTQEQVLMTSDFTVNQSYVKKFSSIFTMPKGLVDGHYQLYLSYKAKGHEDLGWTKLGSYYAQAPSFINVDVTNGNIEMSYAGKTDLEVLGIKTPSKVYQNKDAQFTVTFKNNGMSYDSLLGIALVKKDDDSVWQYRGFYNNVYIGTGDELDVTVNAKVTVKPGEYYVRPIYDINVNNTKPTIKMLSMDEPVLVTVEAEPINDPILSLVPGENGSSEVNIESGNGGLSRFTIRIQNKGGYYAGKIKFKVNNAGAVNDAYGYAEIESGETKDVEVSGELMASPGQFSGYAYYNIPNTDQYEMIDGAYIVNVTEYVNTSGLESTADTQLKAYPNPVEDILYIENANNINRVDIYNINGVLVGSSTFGSPEVNVNMSTLDKGLYIVKIYTEENTYTKEVIKK